MSLDMDAPEANAEHVAVEVAPAARPTGKTSHGAAQRSPASGSRGTAASSGAAPPAAPPTPPLPVVDLPGYATSHDETYQQIHDHLVAAEPMTFFVSEDGKRLVEPGPHGVQDVTPGRFAAVAARHMRFRRRASKRSSTFVELPQQTASRMLTYLPAGWWPVLRGVAHHPVLLPDGRLLTAPGYDPASGWFLQWDCPPIDTAAVTPAVALDVWQRLLDYEFVDDASLCTAAAMFIQPFVRPAISGPTPMFLVVSDGVDAAGAVAGSGAGKTYLPQTVGYATLGREPPMLNPSAWPSEFERQLQGLLALDPEMILLDNVPTEGVLGGSLLHQVLTARESSMVRVVGQAPREVRVRAEWIATGNGVAVDGEQVRRTVLVRIKPGRDLAARPYRTADLVEWVSKPTNRALVASVICRAIEDWIAAGRPKPPRSLASFGSWSDTVGGVLCHVGGPGAQRSWLNAGSRPKPAIEQEWVRLFDGWPTTASGTKKALSSTAVVALLDEIPCPTLEATVCKSRKERAQVSAMGRLLAGRVGVPTGPWVLRTGTSKGKKTWYRPESTAPPPTDSGSPDDPGGTGRDRAAGGPSPENAVLQGMGGTGGTGGTVYKVVVSGAEVLSRDVGVVGGGPSRPSRPPSSVIPGSSGEGSGEGPTPAMPPRPARWRDEVRAMQERGVRVDPELWAAAVAELRAAGIEATREAADPAAGERALHRLVALDSYALDVQAQAELDPEHRVRSTWCPEGTWTGRITAREPPLQSITKQGELRAAVVPAPGRSYVVGDWSQSQLRIAFGLSGEPAGPRVCAPGQDLHAQIGEAVAPGHPEARALGKLLNFAILYLAGADTLVAGAAERGIELTRSTATGLIRRLELAYPVLCAWRRAQAGLLELPVTWDGELHRTVPLPSSAFDATGTPSLPKILAGIMQAHEVEALRFVLDHTEQRLGALGYRPVLLVHDEVVWEGPTTEADEAREAAHALMVEALAGVTRGIPALATVEVRRSWAANG